MKVILSFGLTLWQLILYKISRKYRDKINAEISKLQEIKAKAGDKLTWKIK